MNRARLPVIQPWRAWHCAFSAFSILLLLVLSAIQVHRSVGHDAHASAIIKMQSPTGASAAEKPDECMLCNLAEGMNPLLPSSLLLAEATASSCLARVMLALAEARMRRIDHGWNSRAPPGAGFRPA